MREGKETYEHDRNCEEGRREPMTGRHVVVCGGHVLCSARDVLV